LKRSASIDRGTTRTTVKKRRTPHLAGLMLHPASAVSLTVDLCRDRAFVTLVCVMAEGNSEQTTVTLERLSAELERLRQHVDLLHIECAESSQRCSELQDQIHALQKRLEA